VSTKWFVPLPIGFNPGVKPRGILLDCL
jgi:hypothetical protein